MLHRAFAVSGVIISIALLTGCQLLYRVPVSVITSAANTQLVGVEETEAKTEVAVAHIPFMLEPDEEVDEFPIFSLFRSVQEEDGGFYTGFGETGLLTIYRAKGDGRENREYSFLEFSLLAHTFDRHGSLFYYGEDRKGATVGLGYVIDYRDER